MATVTGTPAGEPPITESSPPVEVRVVQGAPSMTIEKLQRIAGKVVTFTTAQLTASLGETVEYEITVKNTGNLPLALSSFIDTRCDTGTISGGPGASEVAPGASTTYMCTHLLTSGPNLVNVAVITGTASGEEPIKLESAPVEVQIPSGSPPKPSGGKNEVPKHEVPTAKHEVLGCRVQSPILSGVSGPKRGRFTVHVGATGVKRLSFYLDGRKIRTMTPAQAKAGKFSLRLDARKLSYGVHRVAVKESMINPACGASAASRVFVRPKQFVAPDFTG